MKVSRMALLSAVVVISNSLAGCATTPPQANYGESEKLLAESANRATVAQEELARIQTARTAPAPKPVEENLAGVPEDLRKTATMEWTGPAEEAARRMAQIVGWDFRVIGNPPATPVMVNVSMRNAPAVKIMENIGLQAQPFAQVVAVASSHRIEFRNLSTPRAATSPATSTSAPRMSK